MNIFISLLLPGSDIYIPLSRVIFLYLLLFPILTLKSSIMKTFSLIGNNILKFKNFSSRGLLMSKAYTSYKVLSLFSFKRDMYDILVIHATPSMQFSYFLRINMSTPALSYRLRCTAEYDCEI